MKPVVSWGLLSREPHRVVALGDMAGAPARIAGTAPGLAHGLGRSYGDVCLNAGGTLWQTTALDRFIAFDRQTGVLRCEAGVSLREINSLAVPAGWSLPVVPGTEWVTVGGAIANDVHGKNHHLAGTFGCHVRSLTLARSDGTLHQARPCDDGLFAATVGGLGLTGVMLEAELQLAPCPGPWLDTETLPIDGLDAFFALSAASEHAWTHSVAWIDCTAPRRLRGLFLRARASTDQSGEPPRTRMRAMPVTPPFPLVNALTLRPFNLLYHARGRMHGARRLHYRPFLHPLDALHGWNRMYGPRGFHQYQSVVPAEHGAEATAAMLDAIARSGQGSFLAVLKTFGTRPSPGLLSFPRPGVTLALDFPNRGDATHALFSRLDDIVRDAGGRLYPAKDARMPRALFEQGYPALAEFARWRDPGIVSDMSRRLMGS